MAKQEAEQQAIVRRREKSVVAAVPDLHGGDAEWVEVVEEKLTRRETDRAYASFEEEAQGEDKAAVASRRRQRIALYA
jgi:hypothetical protein